jgi:hypothetical protein
VSVSATGPGIDLQLKQIVSGPRPTSIDEVIDRMNAIDAALPSSDGLKWFNFLYRLVAQSVKANTPARGWNDPRWLTRLDVVFANLYFDAIGSTLSAQKTPKSWQALFEARQKTGIDRIQFALAGMNAHINHDLALALLQADSEFGMTPGKTSAEHDDFAHVNGLLAGVIPQALQTLATGIVGEIAQDSGKIGRLLALWNVKAARDLAWDFSDHLRSLRGVVREFALAAQDQATGVIGRAMLTI